MYVDDQICSFWAAQIWNVGPTMELSNSWTLFWCGVGAGPRCFAGDLWLPRSLRANKTIKRIRILQKNVCVGGSYPISFTQKPSFGLVQFQDQLVYFQPKVPVFSKVLKMTKLWASIVHKQLNRGSGLHNNACQLAIGKGRKVKGLFYGNLNHSVWFEWLY